MGINEFASLIFVRAYALRRNERESGTKLLLRANTNIQRLEEGSRGNECCIMFSVVDYVRNKIIEETCSNIELPVSSPWRLLEKPRGYYTDIGSQRN